MGCIGAPLSGEQTMAWSRDQCITANVSGTILVNLLVLCQLVRKVPVELLKRDSVSGLLSL